MSVVALFQFLGGAQGVVQLYYDHFGHANKGRWATMCPLIGRTSRTSSQDVMADRTPQTDERTFQILGDVCTLNELDEQGDSALVAQMRGFPGLGGVSDQQITSTKFEGLFTIYRAREMPTVNTGKWNLLGEPQAGFLNMSFHLNRPGRK